MKTTAACLTVVLWLVGCPAVAAVTRSRLSPVQRELHDAALTKVFNDKQLRGQAVPLQPVVLSSKETKDKGDESPQRRRRRRRRRKPSKETKAKKKKKKEQKKEEKRPHDDDTLTHELVDQATRTPAKKHFDAVDRNGDGKIDISEYSASTRASSRIAGYRFNCSDMDMDHRLDLKEFKEAQSDHKELDRCLSMMLAFKMVDADRNGAISQDELWSNLGGASFDARWAFMVACSDLNGDGKVSPPEFSTDMYGCTEDKSAQALDNFTNFNKSDVNGDGCADEAEMTVAVNRLFGMHLISKKPPRRATVALARRWMSCTDFDSNGCLTKQEYEGLLQPSPDEAHCIGETYEQYEADMDFQIMDTNGNNKVSKQEYYHWCDKLDIVIHQEEADAIFESADVNKNGSIDEEEFVSAGAAHSGDGPGKLFFLRSTDAARSLKSRTAWLGTLRKTWAGVFKP